MSLYDIASYGAMIADEARLQAYREALLRAVTADTVVLDLGTGTGIHALLACQLGARRVYAIEPADAIQVAREIARDNGFEDRIEFVQDVSTRTSLPEPADVIVSDLRGVLPFFGLGLPSVIDARERFLRGGGVMIPQRDELWVAAVEAPEHYGEIIGPWASGPAGLDMRAAHRMATQTLYRKRMRAEQLLAEPQGWGALDYNIVETAHWHATVECSIERSGVLHGLFAWFDSNLADGVSISNAPGEPGLVYGGAFFPLTRPVDVGPGHQVSIELAANLVGDDYVWRWNTAVVRGEEVEESFRQSTFHGSPLSPASLEHAAADHVPELSEQGLIDLEALGLIDGRTPLRDIAAIIAERHPDSFSSPQKALDRVSVLVRRYGKQR